jgi:uncharacterized protein YndB with AHSA1/START domain
MPLDRSIHKTININAPTSKVWTTLTYPDLITQWISDEGTITVTSDWKVGSPILYGGTWNGYEHKDKGTILKFEPESVFQYNYWSKISQLPDIPENYLVIEFTLSSNGTHTLLTLTQHNFATETIYAHWNFYWMVALDKIRKLAEKGD